MVAQRFYVGEIDPSLALRRGRLFWISTTGSMLALLPLCVLPARARWRALLTALLGSGVAFVIFADLLSFRQFGDLASVASLRYAGQLGSVWGSVISLARPADAGLAALALLLLALAALPSRLVERLFPPLQRRLLLCVAVAGIGAVVAAARLSPRIEAQYVGSSQIVGDVGILAYQAYDTLAYGKRLSARLRPSGEAVARARGFLDERRRSSPPAASPLNGVARGRSVIVLQLESFQDFLIGFDLAGQPIAPALTRLAAESVRFTSFYHQAAQGGTADADLLVNCSVFPTRTGAVYFDYADDHFLCLPRLLTQAGYSASAMQGMRPDFWNLGAVYPHVGFQRYLSARDFTLDETIGLGLSDRSFLRQVAARLAQEPGPSYTFVVTLTSHGPFDYPELPRSLQLGPLEGTRAGHYLHAVHYTDSAIGAFVEELRASGVLDRSILVVYGDHTGISRANSNVAELLPIPPEDEVAWFRAERRIPFLIRLPGGAGAAEQELPAGQVDVAPTVAGLLGLDITGSAFFGRDLFATPAGDVAFPGGAAVSESLLHLPSAADPAGSCRSLPAGTPLPPAACAALGQRAGDALAISWDVVERDLVPALTAPGLVSTVAAQPQPLP